MDEDVGHLAQDGDVHPKARAATDKDHQLRPSKQDAESAQVVLKVVEAVAGAGERACEEGEDEGEPLVEVLQLFEVGKAVEGDLLMEKQFIWEKTMHSSVYI